jgi:hypothetical protein
LICHLSSLYFFHCCRQRIAEWSEPDPLTTDKKQKGPLLELLDQTQEEYRRLIAGANAAAGKKWDGMLENIMESNEVASAIRKDDLYNLANVGINDDWSVEAGMQIFCKEAGGGGGGRVDEGGGTCQAEECGVCLTMSCRRE